jgi:hypothetical protein
MKLITLRPQIKFINQIACVVSQHTMNSAFIVEEAIIVCLVLFQDIIPYTRRKNVS